MAALPLNLFDNFNSIKVRLELKEEHRKNYLTRFQFHKGTIRTHFPFRGEVFEVFNFNSIKVRLERNVLNMVWIIVSDFNSIKVRLELSKFFVGKATTLFQFHKGTIRTPCRLAVAALAGRFQFHKGTIRTRTFHSPVRQWYISIP